jgi:hypothetical protein
MLLQASSPPHHPFLPPNYPVKKLIAILLASMVLNGVLAGYILLRLNTAPTPLEKTPAVGTSITSHTGLSDETKRLLTQENVEHLDQLRDRLRAEGLPESIVRSVVEQRLWQARQIRLDAADPSKKRPWWQQISGHLPGDDVRMARLEEKLRDEVLSKRDELFPETKQSTPDDSIAFLSPAKRQAVQRLRDDYYELQRKLLIESGGAYNNGAYITSADQQKLTYLNNEQEKDLRAVLTPDEYNEMQLRTAGNEDFFKKTAAFLNLSEHQFRGLMDIHAWREQADAKLNTQDGVDPFAPMSPEIARKYQQITDDEKQKFIELIGEDKLQLMELAKNSEYEGIARYIARFELPQSHIAAYFAITHKGIEDAAAIQNNPALSSGQRTESIKLIAQAYDVSISKLLGSNALDENLGMSAILAPAARTSCFRMEEK